MQQAHLAVSQNNAFQLLARSEGFQEEWLTRVQEICQKFGTRPSGLACPLALFSIQFNQERVAIVHVCDSGKVNDSNLLFRFLIIPTPLYQALGSDPFRIATTFPPLWNDHNPLPCFPWPGIVEPTIRGYKELQKIINVPYSATLLGGAQALVDGSKLVFERTQPAPILVESLWALLPLSTRSHLWPSTFAFSNDLAFDIAVVPRAGEAEFQGYLVEAMAGDYPEGRYELDLQVAIENGDQNDLNRLFYRRNRQQTLNLACWLLALFVFSGLLGLILQSLMINSNPKNIEQNVLAPQPIQAPPLTNLQRENFQKDLSLICRRYRINQPSDSSELQLLLALESLDQKLDQLTGKTSEIDSSKNGHLSNFVLGLTQGNPLESGYQLTFGPSGLLRDKGSLQNLLRYMIWKRGGNLTMEPQLNPSDLLEHLEKTLIQKPSNINKELSSSP